MYFPRCITEDCIDNKKEIDQTPLNIEKRKETILIVDDEKSLSDMASGVLSNNGYKTIKAFSAKQALEILKSDVENLNIDIDKINIFNKSYSNKNLLKRILELIEKIKHPY